MKQYLLLFVWTFLFISCDKEDKVPANEVLEAKTYTDLSYGSDPAQKMDLYLPAGRTDTTKLIIMVHGGAWTTGDKSDFNSFIPVVQQRLPGYAIANINYRLATPVSNHFPSQENDMKAAVEHFLQQNETYHISEKIVLLGASAGGHMVLLQAYKNAQPPIKAVIDFFGPSDMAAMYNDAAPGSITRTGLQIFLQGTPTTNPGLYQQSSPINYVSAQSPPTLILHGTTDNIVPIGQSTALKNKLVSFGVVNQMVTYPGYGHEIWPPQIMNDAFEKIEAFIKTNVH